MSLAFLDSRVNSNDSIGVYDYVQSILISNDVGRRHFMSKI